MSLKWKQYAIVSVISLAVSIIYLSTRDFSAKSLADALRLLCDAFTVSGMLLVLSTALLWLLRAGALDGAGYIGSFLLRAFISTANVKEQGSYYAYTQRKREKRKNIRIGAPMLAVGAADLALSLVMLIWYLLL